MARTRTLALSHDTLKTMALATFFVMLVLLLAHPAWSQNLPSPVQAKDFKGFQQNISRNASTLPKLLAMFSYTAGAFFAASGLLKLKDWITDGDRNPMLGALMRLIVATLLVALPHTLYIVNGSFFKRSDGSMDAKEMVAAPHLNVFNKAGQ